MSMLLGIDAPCGGKSKGRLVAKAALAALL